jgi:hypothetical protein
MQTLSDNDRLTPEEFLFQERQIEEALLESLEQDQSRGAQTTTFVQATTASPLSDCSLYSDDDYDSIFMNIVWQSDSAGQRRHGQHMDTSSG